MRIGQEDFFQTVCSISVTEERRRDPRGACMHASLNRAGAVCGCWLSMNTYKHADRLKPRCNISKVLCGWHYENLPFQ